MVRMSDSVCHISVMINYLLLCPLRLNLLNLTGSQMVFTTGSPRHLITHQYLGVSLIFTLPVSIPAEKTVVLHFPTFAPEAER